MNKIEIVQLLIQKGADPNKKDTDGKAPLHYAIILRREDMTILLLEAGADPYLEDIKGISSMAYTTDESKK